METPLVHVLVINWNGLEHLDACFASLLEGTYENVQYILVDNDSEDESVEFVRRRFGEDPRVRILDCGANLGWSGGNNAALLESLEQRADYIFLINNDTATHPEAIAHLVAMAEARPEIGALAPKMVLFDYPEVLNSVGIECSLNGSGWDKGVGRLDAPRWNTPEPVIAVCGGACFLRAEALRHSGLLPEEFEIYLDDLDLGLRIWNAGYEIWSCPQAVVRHKFSATFGAGRRARRKYYLNTRNRMWLVLRNFPWYGLPRMKLAMAVGETRAIGRALLDGEPWRACAHVRAWAAGLFYVPRALLERWWRWRVGLGRCRFWHLVRKDRLFCPGFAMPVDGWYPEREVRMADTPVCVRPISRRATAEVSAGRLRVIHANCYPHLGATDIRVLVDGTEYAALATRGVEEMDIDVPKGCVVFEAKHVFDADDTGEIMDVGGWIRIERT